MDLSLIIRLLLLGWGLCLFVGPAPPAVLTRAAQSSSRVKPAAAPAADPRAERMAFAARFFQRRCASCHSENFTGVDARKRTPQIPDFTSAAWQTRRSDAQLLVSILDGKGKDMPSFQGRLDRDKASALVAYVRQAGPPRPAPPDAPDDFERRFAELKQQLEELREQYRRLVEAAEKREAKGANKTTPSP